MQVPYPIKSIIVGRGLRQCDVAADNGVNAHTFSRIVNRHVAPWPALRHRLAEYLELPESALFDDGPVSV